MSLALKLAAVLLLALAAVPAQAATAPSPLPGLDVEDGCMAQALRTTGFQGEIRVRDTRSTRFCDVEAETDLVADYSAVAGPCMAASLRDQGFLGRIIRPLDSGGDDPGACAIQVSQLEDPIASAPSQASDLATFKGADGVEITAMRPIPDPEDLSPADRRRIYGKR